jgi:hypothetical protein
MGRQEPRKTTKAQDRDNGRRKVVWVNPLQGWIKLNIDASFCPTIGAGSVGVVARGYDGSVLLMTWRFLRQCGSPEEAGTEASLEGMRLSTEWIHQPVCAETDCSILVKGIQSGNQTRSGWVGIISEIHALSNLLPVCTFNHIGRDANKVAHH